MEIKNRLFPYPVLCFDNDDYVDSIFSVDVKVSEEVSDLVFNFTIKLENNEELKWLIRDGKAEFAIHIECSATAYRTLVFTSGMTKTYRIPKSKVNDKIALLGLIVAKTDIKNYTSNNLNEDYLDEYIYFEKGSILAYHNMPKVNIAKNYEELAGDNAFFTVIKRTLQDTNEINPVTYELNGPKIKILVDEPIYDEYIKYYNNPNLEPLANSLVVFPALIYMLETIQKSGSEPYRSLYWYMKIKKSFELQGKDFDDYVYELDKSCVEIAQEMLQMPIGRAFNSLTIAIEE